MSLSATLVIAAAAASAPAESVTPRGVVLVEARVTARILPAAVVRQAGGPEPGDAGRPRHQLSRRGNTVLVEYQ